MPLISVPIYGGQNVLEMAIRHKRQTTRTELQSFLSVDLFRLTFNNIGAYGVALAMHHRLQWFIYLRAHGLRKGDEHPADSPHRARQTTFFKLLILQSDPTWWSVRTVDSTKVVHSTDRWKRDAS